MGLIATDTAAGEATLLSQVVPLGRGQSLYSHTGDWLAWLCLLLTVQTVIKLGRRKRGSVK